MATEVLYTTVLTCALVICLLCMPWVSENFKDFALSLKIKVNSFVNLTRLSFLCEKLEPSHSVTGSYGR